MGNVVDRDIRHVCIHVPNARYALEPFLLRRHSPDPHVHEGRQQKEEKK